ncbi:MAG: SPOR domain-containing protein [Granulosicoccus sp.]
MSRDAFEEDNSFRLRQRLWGAAVLIAIAVIVLPLLLDGAGSESQFRRVERLREEPPAIVDRDGTRQIQVVPEMRAIPGSSDASDIVERVIGTSARNPSPVGTVSDDSVRAERVVRENMSTVTQPQLTAWVVQASSFVNEIDAITLRDQLRSQGFASFVRDRDLSTDPYRVLVGPMIKQESAEKARKRVAAILQNDPLILSYP